MKRIFFYLFFCFNFITHWLSAQCDSIFFTATYTTYVDSMPEYYGNFNLLGKGEAMFYEDEKEKKIALPLQLTLDSLEQLTKPLKIVQKIDSGVCVYDFLPKATHFDFNTSGNGTQISVSSSYVYHQRQDTLLGRFSKDTLMLVQQDTVTFVPINFYFPNVISPNGDMQNDEFQVFRNENVLIDRIHIFDRWGNLCYQEQNVFSKEIHFGAAHRLNQGDFYVGFLQFKNTIIKRFSFSVVK